ncbi:MAG: methyl-accepting chemotaxis protein [Candidatus Omnitrophota bacterium]|nr:methyl-accepting chemotaxis protein [Candidatus Omnitrophota bacterium]
MQEGVQYRRKQYFVAKKFQLKYVGVILLLVFLTAIMCSYVIYYTMMLTMGDKLANVYPQGRLIAIVNMVNFRILFVMLLLAPIIVITGIYASHKIAGPLYRIERFFESVAGGDFSMPIILRKNDELKSLTDGINKVVESVKTTLSKEKSDLDRVSASLKNLRSICEIKPIDNAALDKALKELGEEVSVLQREVEKYKI